MTRNKRREVLEIAKCRSRNVIGIKQGERCAKGGQRQQVAEKKHTLLSGGETFFVGQ